MIKIICVGKIKEDFFKEAVNEYQKRISKYAKIEIIEIPDEPIKEKAKAVEGLKILNKINSNDYVITLEIEGKQLDSVEFSKAINNWKINHSNIIFVIGGSYGLGDEIKQRSNYKLSFSKMTFPHQLFRIILLEQIYRSHKIISGETYHK